MLNTKLPKNTGNIGERKFRMGIKINPKNQYKI